MYTYPLVTLDLDLNIYISQETRFLKYNNKDFSSEDNFDTIQSVQVMHASGDGSIQIISKVSEPKKQLRSI